jgi:6-phospho-beta-glucosidase
MKLVIVGGGSSYTPELTEGIIEHFEALPFDEVSLMDINEERLKLLTGLTERMLRRAGLPVKVTATTDLERALEKADYVNCLIRVGGMDARISDERIPVKYGIIGQETTGPGGMMKALRTIPVMLDLAGTMLEVCPDAWLINYTNPSGIIAEALGTHSKVRYIGLCSGPRLWSMAICRAMGMEPEQVDIDWIGLNHLGFAVRVRVEEEDVTAQAVEAIAAIADRWGIDAQWLRILQIIPNPYLRYFYHHTAVVEEMRKPGYKTRGEQVKEMEADLLRLYADPNLAEKPAELNKRGGGGYADVAFAAMHAIHKSTSARQIVQVLNGGALDGIPDDASVEIACRVDGTGAHPVRFGEIPPLIRSLIQQVKTYESFTVQAAVEQSRSTALKALMVHPLVPSWDVARPLFEELLAANRPWLTWST